MEDRKARSLGIKATLVGPSGNECPLDGLGQRYAWGKATVEQDEELHPGSVTVVLQGEGRHEYQAVYVRQPGCKLIFEFVEEE